MIKPLKEEQVTNEKSVVKQPCIFCPEAPVKTFISKNVLPGKVAVLKCGQCGLVFLEARSDVKGEDPEERAYWRGDQKKVYMQEKVQKVFRDEFEQRLETFKKYGFESGKLLDIGCGVGHFLEMAKNKGWDVKGLDISPVASEAAKEKYGLDVYVGTLEEAPFRDQQFDVVCLWDVIEHIRKPVENLKAANRILKEGGLLVMKTPNEESLFKGIAVAAYRMLGNLGSFLLKYVYYVPHYFSYSKSTMNKLLNTCGFAVAGYELDETPAEFGVEKINAHYGKDPKRRIVIFLLPLVQRLARAAKRQNKLIVYATKDRNLS